MWTLNINTLALPFSQNRHSVRSLKVKLFTNRKILSSGDIYIKQDASVYLCVADCGVIELDLASVLQSSNLASYIRR